MSSLNRAELIGNVGKDPNIRTMQNGDKVASLSIATSEKWRDKAGVNQERTTWHNVVVWGHLANTVENWVRKGSKLYVAGSIQTRKWQGQDGADRYTTEIVLRGYDSKLILLGDRSGPLKEVPYHGSERGQSDANGGGDLDDEVPF